ncbi:site-2 protease family protein [Candidatus Saccharibacteria bacterium]|nr:site-2 protease family protein [Candidatus Saccharibacteria bacterium]MBR0415659.1 site-2 protease family protein [Candidatus Saccharibacteria bacterium]
MNIGLVIAILAVILISMILHELAHGVVAYLLGDTTAKDEGRLSLNPLKHLDPITSVALPLLMFIAGGPVFGGAKPVPVDSRRLKWGPFGMALVAIAGPLTNFILALISFVVFYHAGLLSENNFIGVLAANIVTINLGFFVFNILPIPPLDGSRLLYAIAPDGVRDVMEKMENSLGIWLVFGLIVIFSSVLTTLMSGMITGIVQFFLHLVGAA